MWDPLVTSGHEFAPLGAGNTEAASDVAGKTDVGMTVLSTASGLQSHCLFFVLDIFCTMPFIICSH